MEMIDKIEKLLDEKVRPSLHAHGGDVVIKSYEDGVLKVKMIGNVPDVLLRMQPTRS